MVVDGGVQGVILVSVSHMVEGGRVASPKLCPNAGGVISYPAAAEIKAEHEKRLGPAEA